MAAEFKLELSKIIKDLSLETIYLPCSPDSIFISNNDVNRPGLQLGGYYMYFDPSRIQIVGKAKKASLSSLTRRKSIN